MPSYYPPGGGLTSPVGIADGGTGATDAEGARAALRYVQSDPFTATFDPGGRGITYSTTRRLTLVANGGATGAIVGKEAAIPVGTKYIAAWAPIVSTPTAYGVGGIAIRDGTYVYLHGSATDSGGNTAYARYDVSTGTGRTGLTATFAAGRGMWVGWRETSSGVWAPVVSHDGVTWSTGASVVAPTVTPTHYMLATNADGAGPTVSTRCIICATSTSDFTSQIPEDLG